MADETLRIVCDVVRRGKAVPDVEVDLLNADGSRARRVLTKTMGAADRTIDVQLDLVGLAPGGYRVRIRSAVGSASAEREVPFIVRPVAIQ